MLETSTNTDTTLDDLLEKLEAINERLDIIDERLANISTPGVDYGTDDD